LLSQPTVALFIARHKGHSTAGPAEREPCFDDSQPSRLKEDIMSSAEVLLTELAAALPLDALIVDRDVTRSLSHDDAEWAPFGEPLALIRATSSDHVAATVRICARFGVPVTARGAGTGLSGGDNAIEGGVIIALDRLNQIRLIDPLSGLPWCRPA
jgi:glycolate oxidase